MVHVRERKGSVEQNRRERERADGGVGIELRDVERDGKKMS